MLAQQSRPGSPVQTHNYPALPPPWQKCSRSPRANDANKAKKRKIEPSNTNSNEQPPTQINTHNRFAVLESLNDAMEIADPPSNHHAQRSPPPPPIFVNDVIDIQTMIKSLEREISPRRTTTWRLPTTKSKSCRQIQKPTGNSPTHLEPWTPISTPTNSKKKDLFGWCYETSTTPQTSAT